MLKEKGGEDGFRGREDEQTWVAVDDGVVVGVDIRMVMGTMEMGLGSSVWTCLWNGEE